MITFLNQIYPEPRIDWLHGETRIKKTTSDAYSSSGPSAIIPMAIFTIDTGLFYYWEDTMEW